MGARLRAFWRRKLLLTALLNLLFWPGYVFFGGHVFFPIRTPPLTWLDAAIPFQPEPWGWIYLSQFLFTGTVPWLIDSRQTLRCYVIGFAIMSLASFAVFAVCPVASPRPTGVAADKAMTLILGYDGMFNAFPSLHAAFLFYTAGLVRRIFGARLPLAIGLAAGIWGLAILYATIATRQHYAIDLVAGAALGASADWIAWRGAGVARAAAAMARSNPVASHGGCK